MLKKIIAKLEDVAEELRPLYKASGDQFVLDIEGDDDSGKLTEFRDNNRRLFNENDELKKQMAGFAEKLKAFDGFDPAEMQRTKETADKLKRKELIEAGDFERMFEEKLAPMREQFSKQIGDLEGHNKTLESEKKRLYLNSKVAELAPKYGVNPDAMRDVVRSVGDIFTTNDQGEFVALNADGTTMRNEKTGDPITVESWMQDIPNHSKHYLNKSAGGGSSESRQQLAPGIIAQGSNEAFLANLSDLASGKVKMAES